MDFYSVGPVSALQANYETARATESRCAVLFGRRLSLRPPGYSLGSAWLIRKARSWLPARRASFFCAVSIRLGRYFRDVCLLAQKAIAFLFRDDDVPKAWEAY